MSEGSEGGAAAGSAFVPPRPVSGLALRRRVLDLLSVPDIRLAIVTAPAGYGKTSHAIAWVAADARQTAWLDLLDRHNDARILLADLVAALTSVTDFRDDGLASGGATADQYATGVATSFGKAVRACSDPFVLVLDDVHRIDDAAAGDLIESLAANIPTGSTVLLAGRTSRLRPTVALQVGPASAEITTADLALGPADVSRVLSALGVSASNDDVERVAADTEGWPVGVRLAGLARLAAARRDTTSSPGLTGRESAVYDYIQSEWLWGLSDDDRGFLLRVSLLDFLTAPLCNHVLGRSDSGALLHRFFADRLLVIPLDRREDVYRLHGLLRDALQAALERSSTATAQAIHARASSWFEAAGDIERAVRHAVAAEDLDRAEQLVTQHSPRAYASGHFTTISRWVGSFPRDRVLRSPSLCLCAALAALGSGDGESLAVWLRLGEHAAADNADDDPLAWLGLLNLRATSNTGPVGPAIVAATEAYQGLPPGIWHAGSCLALGVWRWTAGDDLARRVVEEGAAEATVLGAPAVAANCTAVLAMMAHESGDPARMRTLAGHARSMLAAAGLERAPAMALVTAMSALAAASSGSRRRLVPTGTWPGPSWPISRTSSGGRTSRSAWHSSTRVCCSVTGSVRRRCCGRSGTSWCDSRMPSGPTGRSPRCRSDCATWSSTRRSGRRRSRRPSCGCCTICRRTSRWPRSANVSSFPGTR